MRYEARTFTLPASNTRTTELHWDLATLSREQFIAKYSMTPEEYCNGKQRAQ